MVHAAGHVNTSKVSKFLSEQNYIILQLARIVHMEKNVWENVESVRISYHVTT